MSKQSISPAHALLGLLMNGERHGYELKHTIDQEFAPYWHIDFAQLYRSLAKMTRAGWVKSRIVRGKSGPNRKLYTTTVRGRQAFEIWLAQSTNNHDEFFVKVHLAGNHGLSVLHLIEPQRRTLEDKRAQHSDAHRAAQDAGNAGRLVVAHAALRETEASLAALDLYTAVTPYKRQRASSPARSIVISGSDDPLLARVAQLIHTSTHPVGSIGGLLALSQHQADIAGVHLLDADTGEYNIPFVKHLLPEDDIVLVNLAFRENGLIIALGNPKNIRGVRDLTRRGIRFINRARGTGTRLLLYSKLKKAHIDPHTLNDWDHTAATHDAVAAAIATGAADAGPGLRATAAAWNLDFIPLGKEEYDLAIPRGDLESARLEPIIETLHSKDFRHWAEKIVGYDLARSGRVMARIK